MHRLPIGEHLPLLQTVAQGAMEASDGSVQEQVDTSFEGGGSVQEQVDTSFEGGGSVQEQVDTSFEGVGHGPQPPFHPSSEAKRDRGSESSADGR